MIKLILLGILVTKSLWSISQNGYPKEIRLNNDTIICFTYNQIKEINSELENSQGKDKIISSLKELNTSYESVIITGQNLILNYKQQIEEYKVQINLSDKLIYSMEKENQRIIRKSRTNKFWGILGGFIGGALITGVTVGIIVKN